MKVAENYRRLLGFRDSEPLLVDVAVRLTVHSAETNRIAPYQLVCPPWLLVVDL